MSRVLVLALVLVFAAVLVVGCSIPVLNDRDEFEEAVADGLTECGYQATEATMAANAAWEAGFRLSDVEDVTDELCGDSGTTTLPPDTGPEDEPPVSNPPEDEPPVSNPPVANEWPALVCNRTGEHAATADAAQGRIAMHSLQSVKAKGDRCTIEVPEGVTISYVNSPAGGAKWRGQSLNMANPVTDVNGQSSFRGPGTFSICWGPWNGCGYWDDASGNDSAGALVVFSMP